MYQPKTRTEPKTGCLLRRTEDRAKTVSFETLNTVFTNLGPMTSELFSTHHRLAIFWLKILAGKNGETSLHIRITATFLTLIRKQYFRLYQLGRPGTSTQKNSEGLFTWTLFWGPAPTDRYKEIVF